MEKTNSRSKPQSNNLPLVLLFTVLVLFAYGLTIPRLSFYGDDWIYIFNHHTAGPLSFKYFTAWDRPFSAWVYTLACALFGENVLPYHLLLLVQRWLSVFLFWRVLKTIWGERDIVTAAVLIFALYPGFRQQPISVQYIMHFASLDLALFSILCMLTACKGKKSLLFTILGIFSSAVSLFTCEYFVGLEFLRPLFLFFLIKREMAAYPNTVKKVFFSWLPYIVTLGIFLFWRVFIFSFQTYQPKFLDKFTESPISALLLLGKTVFADLITVLYKAYRITLNKANLTDGKVPVFLFVFSLGFCLYVFFRFKGSEKNGSEHLSMLLCGTVGLFAAGIPFWTTFIEISTEFPWDRSTLSFSPAAALFLAAFGKIIFKPKAFRVAFAGISALSVCSQYANGCLYAHEAEKMNDYFWQLAWRAPALEPGTIIASDEIPLNRYSDGDLTPVLNWQYAPGSRGYELSYKYFDLDLREESFYSDPKSPQDVDHGYRSLSFHSNTKKTLGIFYRENGCLQIIDEGNRNYPGLPESLSRIRPLSDPALIRFDQDQAVPPKAIGPEPQHGFCYSFQQITKALQRSDLESAAAEASRVADTGSEPYYASDWAPVLAALSVGNDTEKALEITRAHGFSPEEERYLCKYLSYYAGVYQEVQPVAEVFCSAQ